MLLMGLVRLNVTTMLVMMYVRSHMFRVVLRFVMLRMLNVTAVRMVLRVMLRHFNLLN